VSINYCFFYKLKIKNIFLALSKYIHSPELLIIGRLIIGIECGLYTGLCTMYLSEVSPKRVRGVIGSLSGLSAYFGLMLAEIFSMPVILGTDSLWPLIMVIAAVPSVVQFMLLQFCYESPRFLLMNRGDEEGARRALSALRQRHDVQEEINEMKQEAEHLKGECHVSIRELFTQPVFRYRFLFFKKINISLFSIVRLPLAVAIVVHFSMRFCGINAIMYYSTALFKHANLGTVGPYATIGVGVILVLVTLLSGSLMDHAGRRTLHLLGLFGTWLCSLLLTITFVNTVYLFRRLLFCKFFLLY
jgi:MFS family permease